MPRLNQTTAWKFFVDWCHKRGLKPLPANPWTVAAYARWCETHHRYQTIVNIVKAIAKEHMRKSRKRPDRHPLVTRTLNLIAQRQEEQEIDKTQAAALFREEDFTAAPPAKAETEAEATAASRVQREVQTRTQDAAQGIRRALRATPKLVSRRPSMT
ncbi:MAG: hypothetical protein CMM61_00415 [Rhodospirillaceae bacterium]|nr:hypothetical protein [Rhodospirillaceae bacterium]